jgi:hypothetical protein
LISWIFFHKNQFIERDNSSHTEAAIMANKKWHFWKGVNQLVFFGLLWFSFGLVNAALCAVLFWTIFDSSMNKFVLHKELFYVGTTSWIDRQTQAIAKFAKVKASVISVIGKSTVLALVIIKILVP